MTPMAQVRVVTALGLVLLAAGAARAQSARAYLSQNDVALNQQFVLNVEVSNVQQLEADPTLPDLSGFGAYLGSGSSTSMQFVNGRTSLSLTMQYRFQATTAGTFEIGPVAVRAGGRDLQTEPLTLRITAAGAPAGRPGARGADTVAGPDDLFVTATASAAQVYVNEPVVVEYRIFTRVNVDSYNLARQPAAAGFWVEELGDPRAQVEQVVRNGVQYASSVIRRVALFPTSAGAKTLEPLAIEAQVRVQRRSRSVFDDPFFGGGLFGRRAPVVVASDPVEIEVLPLPAGQPDAFTGLVGRLDVSASIDRTEADTNDALTYRVEVAGTGNLRTLAELDLRLPPGFEAYPPEVSDQVAWDDGGVDSRKVFEYVLVPRTPGEVVIPPVEVAYFDAGRGAYAAAASAPIALRIAGDPVTAPSGPAGRRRTGIDLEREDIRFIRVATSTFRPIGASLFRGAPFWTMLLAPMLALAGTVALRRHQDRLRGDVAYARGRRASRVARQRLGRAGSLRAPERHRKFHAELGRALQGFLGDKLNIAEAGLRQEEIRTLLSDRGVGTAIIDDYLECLNRCDRQRFAPTEPDQAAMQEILHRAGQAVTALDEALS